MNLLAPLPLLLPLLQTSDAPRWVRRIEWSATDAPPAREHAAFFVDAARDRAVLFAGSGYAPYGTPLADAWAFDLEAERWSPLAVEAEFFVPGGARRVARAKNTVYLHGGYDESLGPIDGLWQLTLDETELHVELVEQFDPPPARMLHAFACDEAGRRFVAYGGAAAVEESGDTFIGERVEDGLEWRMLEAIEPNPGVRFGFPFAYDAQLGRLLVCGGQTFDPENPRSLAFQRDLWAIDFTGPDPTWTRLAEYTQDEFPGRRNPAFTFDPASGDLLIWGGTGDGRTALPDLYVVHTRAEGAPVTRVAQPAEIPTRASCFGLVDARRGRALLGFGNTGAGSYEDLVEVALRREVAKESGADEVEEPGEVKRTKRDEQ